MRRRPLPLLLTAVLVVLEAVVLVVLAVFDLADLGGGAGLGASAGVFFLLCAGALGVCAWGLAGLHSWARAPIVLAEVIAVGLAWDARHTNTPIAILLGVLAVVTLVGVFHPATMRALAPEAYDD